MIRNEDKIRFAEKYLVDANGCWVWQGPLDRDGYGNFYLSGRNRRAHRVGWVLVRGAIGEGMVVNHKCKNRACVNHQHLELITRSENSLKDSLSIPSINARKTHCPEGHPYDGQEKLKNGKVMRFCKACRLKKKNAAAKKRREVDPLKEVF